MIKKGVKGDKGSKIVKYYLFYLIYYWLYKIIIMFYGIKKLIKGYELLFGFRGCSVGLVIVLCYFMVVDFNKGY